MRSSPAVLAHGAVDVELGVTLLELMVVLLVLAVLAVWAIPSYQGQVLGARRALGISALHVLEVRQAHFRTRYGRYARELTELGLGGEVQGIDGRGRHVSRQDEQRIYLLELSTTPGGYTVRATPQLQQASDRLCGRLALDHRGVRSVSGPGGVSRCWRN